MASVLRFEGTTDEEIDSLTLEQYNDIEEQRDQRNAWSVSREVARRVDGAPCMGEHIKATTAIEPSESFFWNKEYIEKFYKRQSLAAKKEIPGYFYVSQIIAFDEIHTEGGELYREFLKGDCETKTGELCDWCKAHCFRGPPCGRIPRPYPAYNEEVRPHYLDVFQTPVCDDSGKPRRPDDFQPRASIRKLVKERLLNLNDDQSIKSCAEKYVVAEEHVVNAVRHIHENSVAANLRKKSQRDQMIFNPEQILGSWSTKECSILMMTRALNRVLRST